MTDNSWTVRLSDAEQRLCEFLARARHNAARSLGIVDKQVGTQDKITIDRDGIAGELGFCKLMNVYPDLEIGHLPVHDATLPNGSTVDVKATTYPNGMLLVPLDKITKRCDLYALTIILYPNVCFARWAWADEIISTDTIVDKGYGPAYGLAQHQLRKPDQLRGILRG